MENEMRTRKIVNKLRSTGHNAEKILEILNNAYKSASSNDKSWWEKSKIRESLQRQISS